jgi:hypothetical protein
MRTEEAEINRDDVLLRDFAFLQHLKLVCPAYARLLKTQVPKFHSPPPSGLQLLVVLPAVLPTSAATTTLATAATFGLRASFVHAERATIIFGAVQGRNGLIGLRRIGHLNEGETAGAARVAIGDQVNPIYGSVRFEHGTDGGFSRAEIQVSHEDVLQSFSSVLIELLDEAGLGLGPGCCGTIKSAPIIAVFRTLPRRA